MSVILIIGALLMFVGLVLIHEWGHFKMARKNGVEVEEFGLGFPPKVFGKKLKSGMLLSINLLPLGGFVRLKGEHDSDTEQGSFGAAPLRAKVKIMLAGVFMNLVVAVAMFGVLAAVGIPNVLPNQFTIASDTKVVRSDTWVFTTLIEEGSPAEEAGMQQRDIIRSINPTRSEPVEEVPTTFSVGEDVGVATEAYAGQQVSINVERGGESLALLATLRSAEEVESSRQTDEPIGYLGVGGLQDYSLTLTRSTWSSPIVAVGVTAQFTYETLKGIGLALGNLLMGNTAEAGSQVTGPIGIFFLIMVVSELGIEFLLFIIAIISLTLAIMNTLPIPALDGGRLFVTLMFRALKKPLTQKTEERIHGTGFVVLMGLFILITIVDVRRFF